MNLNGGKNVIWWELVIIDYIIWLIWNGIFIYYCYVLNICLFYILLGLKIDYFVNKNEWN